MLTVGRSTLCVGRPGQGHSALGFAVVVAALLTTACGASPVVEAPIPSPSGVPTIEPTPSALVTPAPRPTPQPSPSPQPIDCSFTPSEGSDFPDSNQQYSVDDQTGLIETCEVFDVDAIWHSPETMLIAAPDADGTLTFWWLDGICGDRSLRVTRSGEEFAGEVIQVSEPAPGRLTIGPCPAVGVRRGAELKLRCVPPYGLLSRCVRPLSSVSDSVEAEAREHCPAEINIYYETCVSEWLGLIEVYINTPWILCVWPADGRYLIAEPGTEGAGRLVGDECHSSFTGGTGFVAWIVNEAR